MPARITVDGGWVCVEEQQADGTGKVLLTLAAPEAMRLAADLSRACLEGAAQLPRFISALHTTAMICEMRGDNLPAVPNGTEYEWVGQP